MADVAEFDRRRKRRTTVSIDEALVDAAKAEGINLSQTLERALTAALKARRRERWRAENAAAIAAFNARVEERGVFGSEYRRF